MKKLYKHIFYFFLISLLLGACQSVKDGLTGQKKSNSDEFLIEKKNPLVLPSDFDKLPEPKTLSKKENDKRGEINVKDILKKQTTKKNSASIKSSSGGTLEKNILEKIKNN